MCCFEMCIIIQKHAVSCNWVTRKKRCHQPTVYFPPSLIYIFNCSWGDLSFTHSGNIKHTELNIRNVKLKNILRNAKPAAKNHLTCRKVLSVYLHSYWSRNRSVWFSWGAEVFVSVTLQTSQLSCRLQLGPARPTQWPSVTAWRTGVPQTSPTYRTQTRRISPPPWWDLVTVMAQEVLQRWFVVMCRPGQVAALRIQVLPEPRGARLATWCVDNRSQLGGQTQWERKAAYFCHEGD